MTKLPHFPKAWDSWGQTHGADVNTHRANCRSLSDSPVSKTISDTLLIKAGKWAQTCEEKYFTLQVGAGSVT